TSFHYDDIHSVEGNPAVKSLLNIPRFFVNPSLFDQDPSQKMYRPLLLTSYAIDHAISGDRGHAYHFTNLLAHAAAAMLLYFVIRKLMRMAWPTVAGTSVSAAAAFGALVFAVHPLNSEAVNYVSARSSLLCGVALLGATIAYLREDGETVRWKPLGVTAGCF